MAELRMIAKDGLARRDIGDFAETATALDIERTLDLVRLTEGPKLTYIAGAPGTGKTTAVKRYCKGLGHNAHYIDVACGEGTAWNVAKRIAGAWDHGFGWVSSFNTLAEARMRLLSVMGEGTLLVVDEAQYLHQRNNKNGKKTEAFEWLRALAELGDLDLVFCGDMNLPPVLEEVPQLRSRALRPVIITQVSRADVAAVVDGTPYATEPAVNALHAVARMAGGLRNVNAVVSLALDGARGTGERPTLAHLKAAIFDMKLAPKGVK